MAVIKTDDYPDINIRIRSRTRYSRGETIRLRVLEVEFVRAAWSQERLHQLIDILLEPLRKVEGEYDERASK